MLLRRLWKLVEGEIEIRERLLAFRKKTLQDLEQAKVNEEGLFVLAQVASLLSGARSTK